MFLLATIAASRPPARAGATRALASLTASRPHARAGALASASRPPPVAFYTNDHYEVPRGPALPTTSSFPMEKYRIVREVLQRELDPRGDGAKVEFRESPLVSICDLHTVHTPGYVTRYLGNELSAAENRRIGFPWSPQTVDRSLSSTGGTVAAAHAVCAESGPRFAAHMAGGTHHAYADRGEGFCVWSDSGHAGLRTL